MKVEKKKWGSSLTFFCLKCQEIGEICQINILLTFSNHYYSNKRQISITIERHASVILDHPVE